MFASVRRYRLGPGTAGDVAQRVRMDFVDQVSKVPGFLAYYLIDEGDDRMASVNVFEDRSGAEESNRLAARWLEQENFGALIEEGPEIASGVVVAQNL
jgi:hypothetical protein